MQPGSGTVPGECLGVVSTGVGGAGCRPGGGTDEPLWARIHRAVVPTGTRGAGPQAAVSAWSNDAGRQPRTIVEPDRRPGGAPFRYRVAHREGRVRLRIRKWRENGGDDALLPASALSDGTDKLQTFVEFLGTDPAQSNSAPTQRKVRATAIDEHMHLKVRQGAGQPFANEKIPGKVEVCVDLPSPTSAKGSYRVVVFNPKTGWAGVGVLPVADVVEYLQQH